MEKLNTCAVIVAAGLSSRTEGTHKMLFEINGKTLIEQCTSLFKKYCEKIIVVTGHNKEAIENLFLNDKKVKTIYNENYIKGMFTSVKKGIEQLNCNDFFFTPGDYPNFSEKTLEKMLKNKKDVLIPTFNKRKGHPVLINGKFKNDILKLDDSRSLRDFINSVGFSLIEVDDNSILQDIDTKEDYEKVLRNYEQ